MRKLTLSLALASALAVGAVPVSAAAPGTSSDRPEPKRTYELFGKMLCVGAVPVPIACDVHILRPVEKQELAVKSDGGVLGSWMRTLRETLEKTSSRQASK
jgi:hypothetical protein